METARIRRNEEPSTGTHEVAAGLLGGNEEAPAGMFPCLPRLTPTGGVRRCGFMARLHVLGAGGRAATLSRQTGTFVIETRRSLVIVGAGTGVSRLQDPWLEDLKSRVPRALVILPGLRHDLVAGLPELPAWLSGLEVAIATTPGPASVDDGIGRWLAPPFLGEDREAWLGRFGTPATLQAMRPGRNRLLGESVQVLQRAGGAAAVRVRDAVFAPHQAPGDDLAAFATKASALVVGVPDESRDDPESAVRAWASFALANGVRDLLLAFHDPAHDAEKLDGLLFAASAIFPRTSLGVDMSFLRLTGESAEEGEGATDDGAHDGGEDSADESDVDGVTTAADADADAPAAPVGDDEAPSAHEEAPLSDSGSSEEDEIRAAED